MKYLLKILTGAILTVVIAEAVNAQFNNGDKEVSISASFTSRKYEDADEAWTAIYIPIRLGYFYSETMEIEPEILVSKYKDEDTGMIFSANLAYNICRSDPSCKVIPFLLGGLGFANTMMMLSNIPASGAKDQNWTVLNLGVGFKMFIPKPIALRVDYKYQKFFGKTDVTYHNIFVGFSLFFR